jgi:two-component system, cell cycle sensor histidine kinase and response regulator CckA
VHPDDIQLLEENYERRAEGVEMEFRIVRPDGEIRWLRSRGFPIPAENGAITKIAGVAEDVTERKALEEQLLRVQKLEAVGQLAGGIAHDFNNLLSVIVNYSDFVVEDVADPASVREDATQIRKAADRAAALTRQLLVFSRREIVQPQALDLNAIVIEVEQLLGRTMGENIILRIELAYDLPAIKADPGLLEQALLNLAVNAREAMPRGGMLVIQTKTQPSGDEVLLVVRDPGEGMSPAVLERATDPFFSTKKPGQGTGLGLSTVYGIVTQSSGRLEIDSNPGEGTEVRIFLPVTDERVAERGPGRGPAPPVAGKGTILLVEDEDALRKLAARLLERNGFRVLQAAGGNEGIMASELHQSSIELVITDVVMPHMSGIEMVREPRTARPIMPVLYMSGYPQEVVAEHGELDGPLIEKPFNGPALLRAVEDVLQPSRP